MGSEANVTRDARGYHTVRVTRPYCPKCRGLDIKSRSSRGDQGDGAVVRYAQCRTCGEKFKLVLLPPLPSE